jgi:tetrahydromethanopterin S-methyltransferase subunit F
VMDTVLEIVAIAACVVFAVVLVTVLLRQD